MTKVDELNLLARMSLPAWNIGKGPLKDIDRWRYRNKVNNVVKRYLKTDSYRRYRERYENGEILNLYPWPYKSPSFASWKETPESTFYDLAGCRLRTAESYIAMMIYEERKVILGSPGIEHPNVENFSRIVRHSGFNVIDVKDFEPEENRYVGINRQKAVKLVWSEIWAPNLDGRVIITSYVKGEHFVSDVDKGDYVWYLIGKKTT